MINRRLVEYIENNKIVADIQCGFRKARATTDHLVRLDTYVRKGFAAKNVTVGVFFDLETAYDTTWRFEILKDLHDIGLKGRLPMYIKEFLKGRTFKVNVNNSLSETYNQEAGVPQGNILSVTLFFYQNKFSSFCNPK